MSARKVFVTGGAGFMGSSVVRELLADRYLVTVYDNLSTGTRRNLPKHRNLKFVFGDVRDFRKVSSALKGCEYIVHLAADPFIPKSYQFPRSVAQTNVLGSLNVFHACKDNNVDRIVYISSSEIYGPAMYTPMDEQHPLNPRSTYAASKLAADLFAQTMTCEHDLPIVVLRPFNTFGPRDTHPRFIPEVIRQCLHSDIIRIGRLDTNRDYTYVEDVSRAIVLALKKHGINREVINIGTGKGWRMSEILEMIKKETGVRNRVVEDPTRLRPCDVTNLVADFRKAVRLLGWKPRVRFPDGLRKTISWYVREGKHWKYE